MTEQNPPPRDEDEPGPGQVRVTLEEIADLLRPSPAPDEVDRLGQFYA